ncbi:MAG: DUF4013 domain-containing protein [Thermomicrobiales bacterium]|nr:DUF4013 domain-containing protein [Thermomicrobiales bacterium]
MDVPRALHFMFLDPSWPVKLGVAVLLLTAPGIAATLAAQSLDTGSGIAVFGLASVISFIGGALLYTHYTRIIAMIARDGQDLPLPPPVDAMSMIERAFMQIVFGIVLAITMIPLFCIAACPFGLLASSIESGGGALASLFASLLLILTLGVLLIGYGLLGFSRYVVTEDFGGSLNPGNLIRLFRANPGDWLIAALLPALFSAAVAILRAGIVWTMPSDSVWDDVINTVISTPITAYTTLIGFHLAGQAYRLASQFELARPRRDVSPARNF